MKSFRYYLDIDAENREDAQRQLEDMAGGMSFGDLNCMEMPYEIAIDKQTSEELQKFLEMENDDDMFNKVEPFFSDWDGWACQVEDCEFMCGCDTRDMFRHLMTHTKKELEEVKNND